MAAQIEGIFDNETRDAVLKSKLLLVGAGGIGCELLKNLALTGFTDIHLIDLDTIDVSNLNRQFLFQKQHVGKPKAVVAKESAQKLNPKCNITTYHDSITSLKFDVKFYEQFSAVANALDNMVARKHVNRMCVAANIPLIESGSAGYLGQVSVHKKTVNECFECLPKTPAKNFPTCTIRNTPSETIHCVVWAKHLFNQLFGEEDPDQDVSPDPTAVPPEDQGKPIKNVAKVTTEQLSTRAKAKHCSYDAKILFEKFFHDDVKYLLKMEHLWENRKPPIPLSWDELPDAVAGGSGQNRPGIKDQERWSLKECASVFEKSLSALKKKADMAGGDGILTWDKDDKHSMDFVASCTNLRAHCFGIAEECRFTIKSMAGNIVPAIATTNAMVGGLIAIQLLNVLKGKFEKCRTVYLNANTTATRNKLMSSCELQKANPQCFVCSPGKLEVHVEVNISSLTLNSLTKILTGRLNMIAPDVIVDDGKGTILISSDEDDDAGIGDKTLEEMGIRSGCRLQCDDFFQKFNVILVLQHNEELSDQDCEILEDLSKIKPEEGSLPKENENETAEDTSEAVEDEDEVMVVGGENYSAVKRKQEDENGLMPKKKLKLGGPSNSADADIDVLV